MCESYEGGSVRSIFHGIDDYSSSKSFWNLYLNFSMNQWEGCSMEGTYKSSQVIEATATQEN